MKRKLRRISSLSVSSDAWFTFGRNGIKMLFSLFYMPSLSRRKFFLNWSWPLAISLRISKTRSGTNWARLRKCTERTLSRAWTIDLFSTRTLSRSFSRNRHIYLSWSRRLMKARLRPIETWTYSVVEVMSSVLTTTVSESSFSMKSVSSSIPRAQWVTIRLIWAITIWKN